MIMKIIKYSVIDKQGEFTVRVEDGGVAYIYNMRPRIKRTPVDVRVFDNYIRLGFSSVEASKKLRDLEFRTELNYISL